MTRSHLRNDRHLTMDDLLSRIQDGAIDTVVVAFTDMQGRLQGKRLHGRYFVDHVVDHGTEGCNYLLAVDVEMNTVDGYALTSWESGYGDLEFALDLATLRRLPHEPGAATTGEPSSQARSAISIAVPSFHGTRRRVDRSGRIAKSP